jgi:DNA polymerase III alpha subunit
VRKATAERRVRTAGLVICRQRPGTAKGVVFLTLEDETGFVNVVVWQRVFDEFAVLIKSEPFLAVQGKVQRESGVVHVVARSLLGAAPRRDGRAGDRGEPGLPLNRRAIPAPGRRSRRASKNCSVAASGVPRGRGWEPRHLAGMRENR